MEMADTGSDLILGLVAIFTIITLYSASLAIRFNNVRREKKRIEQLMKE
jgi:hypothetical protein